MNILNDLILSKGKYLAHFDQDMAAFINDRNVINEWIEWLDSGKCDYICYPSRYAPDPCLDPDFDEYFWASSRFFFCKRDILDYTEIDKCLRDMDYLYGNYGDKKRKCPWLEHVMGMMAGKGRVVYPPVAIDRYMIFSWNKYHTGTLAKLNQMPYSEVVSYVERSGGIQYPCDVTGIEV